MCGMTQQMRLRWGGGSSPEVGSMMGVRGERAVVLMPFPDNSDDQVWLTPGEALKLAEDLKSMATELLQESN